MLGLYVSDHPLMGAEASLRRRCDGRLTDLAEMDDGTIRTFGGVVTGLQRKWTKKGDLMAVFALEDLQTSVEVMVFPKSMTDHGHKLADDAVVTVRARVDAREDQPKLIAMEIEPFEPMSGEAFPLRVKVAAAALSEGLIEDLKRLLGEHPGDSPVLLHLGEQKVLRLPEAWTVDVAPGLLAELRVLLGPDRDPGLNGTLTRGSCCLSRLFAVCQAAPELRRSAASTGLEGSEPRVIRGLASECRSRSRPRTALRWGTPSSRSSLICARKGPSRTRSGCCRSRRRRGCSSPRCARTTS